MATFINEKRLIITYLSADNALVCPIESRRGVRQVRMVRKLVQDHVNRERH